MELTEHDHLYMFEQMQRDLQIGKHVLSILQPVIEMFWKDISQIVHYVLLQLFSNLNILCIEPQTSKLNK